jgi:UPF0716 protein FxsA
MLHVRGSGCGPFGCLLLGFTVVPLVELSLLLRVHEAIGLGATLALVLFTGTAGAALARWQGLRTLARLREALGQGQLPGQALFDGAAILFAGALLLTPGVLTDAFGFLLLVPPFRRLLAGGLRRWFGLRVEGGAPRDDGIIDAEVVSSRPVEPPQPAALDPPAEPPPSD